MDGKIAQEGLRAYFEVWFNEFETCFVNAPELAIDNLFDKMIKLSANTGIDSIRIAGFFETAYPEATKKIRHHTSGR